MRPIAGPKGGLTELKRFMRRDIPTLEPGVVTSLAAGMVNVNAAGKIRKCRYAGVVAFAVDDLVWVRRIPDDPANTYELVSHRINPATGQLSQAVTPPTTGGIPQVHPSSTSVLRTDVDDLLTRPLGHIIQNGVPTDMPNRMHLEFIGDGVTVTVEDDVINNTTIVRIAAPGINYNADWNYNEDERYDG
jgi:hypothetical protein